MSPRVKPVTTKGGKKQLLNGNLNTKEKQVGCCLPVWLRPFPHFLGRFFLRLLEMTAEQRMIDFYERHLPFLALETQLRQSKEQHIYFINPVIARSADSFKRERQTLK